MWHARSGNRLPCHGGSLSHHEHEASSFPQWAELCLALSLSWKHFGEHEMIDKWINPEFGVSNSTLKPWEVSKLLAGASNIRRFQSGRQANYTQLLCVNHLCAIRALNAELAGGNLHLKGPRWSLGTSDFGKWSWVLDFRLFILIWVVISSRFGFLWLAKSKILWPDKVKS